MKKILKNYLKKFKLLKKSLIILNLIELIFIWFCYTQIQWVRFFKKKIKF